MFLSAPAAVDAANEDAVANEEVVANVALFVIVIWSGFRSWFVQ